MNNLMVNKQLFLGSLDVLQAFLEELTNYQAAAVETNNQHYVEYYRSEIAVVQRIYDALVLSAEASINTAPNNFN